MLNAQSKILAIRQTVDAGTPLPAIVDELAEVQTIIAVLEAREKNLKARLIETGLKEVCGSSVRVVISQVAASITTDWHALADYLKPDAETVALFAKKKTGYTSVKLFGYN